MAAFELRDIKDLAEELGSEPKARAELRRRGIDLFNGMYNHGAFSAVDLEPKRSNIKSKDKSQSTLAECNGVGAVKYICDKIGLDLTLHEDRQANWYMVRNGKGLHRYFKCYSAQRYANRAERAQFQTSGFLTADAPQYYMFVCYQGPRAWVATRKQLIGLHKRCWNAVGKEVREDIIKPTKDDPEGIRTSLRIPKQHRFTKADRDEDKIKGHLSVTFDPQDEFRFLKASQLGL